jgi:hypothetical protein
MGKPVKPDAKKPYSKPTLTVYGTVRELTKANGPRGSLDGGPRVLRNKTAF